MLFTIITFAAMLFFLPDPAYHHLYGGTRGIRMSRITYSWLFPQQSKRKFELLNRAVQTHSRLTREAATGKGIDRHLMGLQLLMRPEDGEAADLFSDELFQRGQTWKLSTSGLSAGHQFRGTGFGTVYPDGYGINCEWFIFSLSLPNICHRTRRPTDLFVFVFFPLFFFQRSGGSGFDKVWDRVEKILQGNFHGRIHRRHRFGIARHAGNL